MYPRFVAGRLPRAALQLECTTAATLLAVHRPRLGASTLDVTE